MKCSPGLGWRRKSRGGEGGLGRILVVSFVFFLFCFFWGDGEEGIREPYYNTDAAWNGIWIYLEKPAVATQAAAELPPWPLGLHVAG